MTFIDWSDPEGLFGLLVDLVSDELADCGDDTDRRRFLASLSTRLTTLERELEQRSVSDTILSLRETLDSVEPELARDPVVLHIEDCIRELEEHEKLAAARTPGRSA